MRSKSWIAVGWGALMGGITFALPNISSSDTLTILILPGLVAGGAISGNVHAYHLWFSALVNALLHFSLSWILISLFLRFRGQTSRTSDVG
jgi:hypothetical protein